MGKGVGEWMDGWGFFFWERGVHRELALWWVVVLWSRCRQEFGDFTKGLTRTV